MMEWFWLTVCFIYLNLLIRGHIETEVQHWSVFWAILVFVFFYIPHVRAIIHGGLGEIQPSTNLQTK